MNTPDFPMHPPFVQHVERATLHDRHIVGVWPDRTEDQRWAALSAAIQVAARFTFQEANLASVLADADQILAWINQTDDQ